MNSKTRSFLKLLQRALAALFLSVAFLAIVVLAPLFFREREVPREWIDALCEEASGPDVCLDIDSVSVKLPEGFRVRGLRVFDPKSKGIAPLASVEQIDVRLSFMRLLFDRKSAIKRIRIRGLQAPRMPDSWYEPIVDRREKHEPLKADIPKIRPFTLEIYDSNVLGMKVESLAFSSIALSPAGVSAEGMSLQWLDTDGRPALRGEARLDLATQKVTANLAGLARVRGVRPLLSALDAGGALEYVDSFSALDEPVQVEAAIVADVSNNDFGISLDLKASGGIYRNVPLKSLSGAIDVATCTRGTNYNIRVSLKNMEVDAADGSAIRGSLAYECTNEVETIDLDMASKMPLRELTAVADFLNDGSLDFIKDVAPPELKLSGRVFVDPALAAGNALGGSLFLGEGSVAGIKMKNARAAMSLSGDTLSFREMTAESAGGGKCTGEAAVKIPGFDAARTAVSIKASGKDVPLADVGEALKIDLDGRYGTVEFETSLEFPGAGDPIAGMNGRGSVKCRDGRIAQMPLFAGFTSYVSRNVPGVSFLVEQSGGSCDFTISNGVFKTENLLVEGSVFSIRGRGKMDIPKSLLDFTVRATIFRKGSWAATITNPLMWTFTKLLLEFRVRGPFEKPVWESVTMLDRLWRAVSFGGGDGDEEAQPQPAPSTPPAERGR